MVEPGYAPTSAQVQPSLYATKLPHMFLREYGFQAVFFFLAFFKYLVTGTTSVELSS